MVKFRGLSCRTFFRHSLSSAAASIYLMRAAFVKTFGSDIIVCRLLTGPKLRGTQKLNGFTSEWASWRV